MEISYSITGLILSLTQNNELITKKSWRVEIFLKMESTSKKTYKSCNFIYITGLMEIRKQFFISICKYPQNVAESLCSTKVSSFDGTEFYRLIYISISSKILPYYLFIKKMLKKILGAENFNYYYKKIKRNKKR